MFPEFVDRMQPSKILGRQDKSVFLNDYLRQKINIKTAP
jgi:hypothetical protein